MKFLLVFFGSLFALTACKPAGDAGMAQLLLRSCDHNADNALNAAEFAGCLMQTARQQSAAAHGMAISRSELLQSFMDDADMNSDLRADEMELHEWSQGFLLSDLFRNDENSGFSFSEVINKIGVVLQYFSEENYIGAVIELYTLIYGYELSASSRDSINLAVAAINVGNYGEAIGYIYSVIREIAGGDDAGGIFVVSANTVTNVASLLQAVIEGNSANINFYIYQSLAGIIVDFSFISQNGANAVAALIQSIIENNSDELYSLLRVIIDDIPGISSAVATAFTELVETIVSGPSNQIFVKLFGALIAIFNDDEGAELVQILVAVIGAIINGNNEELIKQLTLLYAKITGSSSSESALSSVTIVAFSDIINSLRKQNDNIAVAQINSLIGSSPSGLSSSQIGSLNSIIQATRAGDYTGAIAAIVAIATSGGSVEISVELFVALSSVITSINNSVVGDAAIILIRNILRNTSLTISSEIRSALEALITILSEDNMEEALAVITGIMTGSSQIFGPNN